jgi:formate dehydrogenase subunit delta
MNAEKLGKMANEIAAFFDADPDRTVAMDGFVGHLKRFWDPRMRRELIAWVDGGGGTELLALVRDAIAQRREQIMPAS